MYAFDSTNFPSSFACTTQLRRKHSMDRLHLATGWIYETVVAQQSNFVTAWSADHAVVMTLIIYIDKQQPQDPPEFLLVQLICDLLVQQRHIFVKSYTRTIYRFRDGYTVYSLH